MMPLVFLKIYGTRKWALSFLMMLLVFLKIYGTEKWALLGPGIIVNVMRLELSWYFRPSPSYNMKKFFVADWYESLLLARFSSFPSSMLKERSKLIILFWKVVCTTICGPKYLASMPANLDSFPRCPSKNFLVERYAAAGALHASN